ncbi:MAG: EAL domain-containing protein [Methylocystis sp.]|nr:EAL domain-containing protein [Methylocystis sp.]MCA3585345.1 EAL domain-containing protein [Methylocystis sp.]MCA3589610.1 EAL domain-containing protein [Methylocystis sp.]MCA3591552.1 EAL domain-containing protein [Methylocystis sp.]
MLEKEHKIKARRLATTSVLPFAALLFAILGAVILTVVSMAQRTSEAANDRTRRILTTALTEEVNEVALNLRTIMELERANSLFAATPNPQITAATLERIRMIGDFDSVSLVDSTGNTIDVAVRLTYGQALPGKGYASSIRWASVELVSKTEPPLDPALPSRMIGRYVIEGGDLLKVAGLLRRSPLEPGAIGLVATRSLDADGIARLGQRLSIQNLRLTHSSASGLANDLAVPQADSPQMAALTWSAERPGDPILDRLLPIAIFSALAIIVFAWLSYSHVTRVTANMLRSEEKAQHLAGHDTLSGLPNRLRFTEHLSALMTRLHREETGLAVLFVDLDKFKEVNDTFGHSAGDLVIIGCAERMASQLRARDVLARFGGDEFAIIQTGVHSPLDAEVLAKRLIEAIRPAFQIGDAEAYVGASIGIALAPSNGTDAAELMRLADIAMYRAKNGGRNRACFFEQQMDDTLRIRKVVEDDLRHAISRNELELHYQPQVSADGSRIVGVEALVRWRHPIYGIIPPLEFIGIAEERGLIVQLGEWVIRRACRDAAAWGDISVACNVSAIQFRQADFVQSVAKALEDTAFDPARLELELTESVVVADADQAENSIMELRSMGVKLALDDFGTGYSSLIYLRRFAFDKIKLDKSFLDSLEDTGESAILVHSIVHLGRALGLTVTAEGVETTEQQRFLQAVGCHLLQGYLFSNPVQADKMTRLIAMERPFAHLAA